MLSPPPLIMRPRHCHFPLIFAPLLSLTRSGAQATEPHYAERRSAPCAATTDHAYALRSRVPHCASTRCAEAMSLRHDGLHAALDTPRLLRFDSLMTIDGFGDYD